MTEIIAWTLAAAGMGTTWWFARRCRALEATILAERAAQSARPPSLEATANPLAGLRVALLIRQDHSLTPMANHLRDLLLAEDVASVDLLEAVALGDHELVIDGEVQCNGYSDVYFRAEVVCRVRSEVILKVSERPVHGDRPANLALEITSRLKSELSRRAVRDERRSALRELGS